MWDFDVGTCSNGQLADYLEQVVAHCSDDCGDEVREAARRLRNAAAPELYEAVSRRLKIAEDALTDLQSRLVASVYDGSMNPYEALKVAEDALAAIREEGATK